MLNKPLIILILCALHFPLFLAAQIDGRFGNQNRDIGYLEFLTVDIAPQNAALANAGVANPNGGFLTNPALLANQQGRLIASLQYSPWLRALGIPSLHYNAFQAGLKLSDKHAIGFSYQQFSSLDPLDYGFNATQPFVQLSPKLSYAQHLEKLNWGFTLAYVESGNEQGLERRQKSRGLSLSGGFSYQQQFWGADWLFAASINDWGPAHLARAIAPNLEDISYFLPSTIRLGGRTSWPRPQARFNLLYQVEQLLLPRELDAVNSGWLSPFQSIGDAPQGENWKEWQGKLGIEYSEIALGERLDLAVRLGWQYESKEQGGRNLLSSGLGLSTQHFALDAAYWYPLTRNHPLQNTLLFGLTYRWSVQS